MKTTKKQHANLLAITIAGLFLAFNASAQWSGYRGPNGNGISTETGWNPEKLDTTDIIWTKNVGKGHSGIVVSEGLCYASGWKQTARTLDTLRQTSVFCFDANTGNEVWKYSYNVPWINFPGPRSTPVVDNNKLYHLDWDGQLHCFDTKTGAIIWRRDVFADSLGKRVVNSSGYCTSPAFYEDKLLFNIGESGLALDKNSGKTIWKSNKEGYGQISPKLFNYKGNTACLFMNDSVLSAVSINDGAVLWKYTKTTNRSLEPIQVGDEMLFLGSECISMKEKPEPIWNDIKVSSMFQTGVVVNGYVYQFVFESQANTGLICVELATGKVMWREKMVIWGSLIASGDKLIVLRGKGELSVVVATPEKFTQLASFQALPLNVPAQNKLCWTSPALADGKLYLRNFGGDIACIKLEK